MFHKRCRIYWANEQLLRVRRRTKQHEARVCHTSGGVGVVTRLRAGCPKNPSSMPGSGKRLFSSSKTVQTDFGVHKPPIHWASKVMRPGCEGRHFLSSRAEVLNKWSYISTKASTRTAFYLLPFTFTSPNKGVKLVQNLPSLYNVVWKSKGNFSVYIEEIEASRTYRLIT